MSYKRFLRPQPATSTVDIAESKSKAVACNDRIRSSHSERGRIGVHRFLPGQSWPRRQFEDVGHSCILVWNKAFSQRKKQADLRERFALTPEVAFRMIPGAGGTRGSQRRASHGQRMSGGGRGGVLKTSFRRAKGDTVATLARRLHGGRALGGSGSGERRSDRNPGTRLKPTHLACLVGLASLALLPGLGRSRRLTYHEAFVAQGAREILDSGQWMFPTIGGLPWLEKPPLPWWLTAALGACAGGVDETDRPAPFGAGRDRLDPGRRRAGRTPLWPHDRPACRRDSGHHGVDRASRPAGRGRRSAGVHHHLVDCCV